MQLWTVSEASKRLGVDRGYIRRVLNDTGIPGIEKVGHYWAGTPEAWIAWDDQRRKLVRCR